MSRKPRRFKRYPAYKDSGVEWLGEIPAGWTVRRLKYVAPAVDIRAGDKDLRYVGLENIESGTGRLRDEADKEPNEQASEAIASLFAPDDVLFGKLRPYLAKVVRVDFEGQCSTELLVLRSRGEVIPGLLAYQLLSNGFIAWISAMTYGTKMPRASPSQVFDVPAAIAPAHEQRAIMTFLDRETAKIDALVAKNERLIELLEEKRSALITRAVTKGLDPGVSMKNSGVEWLGDVPTHWTTKHLRFAVTFQRGHDLPTDEREDGVVPVVSSAGPSSTHSRAIAKGPAIVTGRYGTIGHFHLIRGDYWPLNTTLYSIDLHGNEPRFLRYMLMHMSPLFLLNAGKSAVPGVDRNDIHPILSALPRINEQSEIADFLDAANVRIDRLIGHVQSAVIRLNELRTALISAAVTGKIDVREEVT